MIPRPFVLAAGGTGGHVFPAEALAAELLARGHRCVLITDRRGTAFGGALAGVPVHRIHCGGIAGLSAAARIGNTFELALGWLQALRILHRLKPAACIGFGGYAALPTMLAAVIAGWPAVVHDQNAVLGRANRLLAGRVRRICTAFERVEKVPAAAADRLVRVGMPVRPPFVPLRDAAYAPPGAEGPIRLLVLGGSQGAKIFSDVVPEALARLPEGLQKRIVITQQCRPETLEAARAAYATLPVSVELAPFFADVPDRLAAAHLVICRSGASTIAELTTVGRPAILVPYPFAIDDHQTANAAALAAAGGAQMMPQPEFTAESLAARLVALLSAPETLAPLAAAARDFGIPDAAGRLADVVCALLPERQPRPSTALVRSAV